MPAWCWHLWATIEAGGYPHLGYPSQEPWYQPAKLGKLELLDDKPSNAPTLDDYRRVDRLAAAIAEYRQRRPTEVRCLVIMEGAYPEAEGTLEQRCASASVSAATCRRMAARARRAIDNLVGVMDDE